MTHFLAVAWQKLLSAAIGAGAGTLVAYLKLRALILFKHEEMKLHVTRTVRGEDTAGEP